MSEVTVTGAPTAKDGLLFQTILMSMKNKPEVDWAAVADKAGYKTANSASTRYGQIIKKLTGMTASQAMAGTGGSGSSAKSTPKKGAIKVGSGTNTTPSKVTKPKATRGKKNVIAAKSVEEDEADLPQDEPNNHVKKEEEVYHESNSDIKEVSPHQEAEEDEYDDDEA